MSETHASAHEHGAPARYAIRIRGHLDDRWADWFAGLTITREGNGDTLLAGVLADQAALHSLLRRVRDLGLPLVSVLLVEAKQANAPDGDAATHLNRLNREKSP
jgi:hypothetical protein